jgi:hypothetical protein
MKGSGSSVATFAIGADGSTLAVVTNGDTVVAFLNMRDEIERLRARVAVLEGLLAPLSAEADKHDPPDGDDDHLAWGSVLTIGHLREARAALEAKP